MQRFPLKSEFEICNLKEVSNLVFRYFSLDQESFNYFEQEIFNPLLDDNFAKALESRDSQDLRYRWKIPSEFREKIDTGWRIFYSEFGEFYRYYNVSYEDFLNNKVEIDKNFVKLKKAIINYYQEKRYNQFPWPTRDKVFESDKKGIEETFKRINDNSLPKNNDVEIVLSFNFADWLLCSSGETWASCLSLNSLEDSCYWAGLPGLAGDKSRALLYITNGKEKENYGVRSERMMARTWVLIDEKDKLNIIRWYPNTLFDDSIYSLMENSFQVNLDFNFISKNRVRPLTNKEGNIILPFLDRVNTIGDKNNLRFEKGLGGSFTGNIHNEEQVESISDRDLYAMSFSGGLKTLIDRNIEIIDFSVDNPTFENEEGFFDCESCGDEFNIYNVQDDYFVDDNIALCPHCFSEHLQEDIFGESDLFPWNFIFVQRFEREITLYSFYNLRHILQRCMYSKDFYSVEEMKVIFDDVFYSTISGFISKNCIDKAVEEGIIFQDENEKFIKSS